MSGPFFPSCKFCGCTETTPCRIPLPIDEKIALIALPDQQVILCAWLLDDVCTAPACVAKAYAEYWPAADSIMLGLEREAA